MQIFTKFDAAGNYYIFISIQAQFNVNVVNFVYHGKTRMFTKQRLSQMMTVKLTPNTSLLLLLLLLLFPLNMERKIKLKIQSYLSFFKNK